MKNTYNGLDKTGIGVNKKILLMGLVLTLFFSFAIFISAVSFSSPQLTAPGANSFSYLGRQGVNAFPIFNPNQCGLGNDFIIQIAPFGCTPSVVRSDLLEEQNVPVFCQLYATKINPLIDVEAIDFISFEGEYPNEIAGIGFHPANAAVRSTTTTLLNSPVIQNIGYAVIVLKQNPNESSMPDFVSGNLTAKIRYDIQNAFGVGAVGRQIPEITDDEWNENYRQYGFWDGRGFLRVEGIDENGAVVSIYSDAENKVSTFNLDKGQVSGDVYLPGFYCRAALNVRLDEVKSPDTRARLNINGEVFEVAEGERFFDNNCVVRDVEKKGLTKKTEIRCRTDDGAETLNFEISPKIKLSIDGVERNVKLGERLFTTSGNEKSVYLAYVGTDKNTENVEDLFVYFLATPTHKESLTEDELDSASFLVRAMETPGTSGERGVAALARWTQRFVGYSNRLAKYLIVGDSWDDVRIGKSSTKFGKEITLVGLVQSGNVQFSDETAGEYYENAMKDYREIIDKFAGEKPLNIQNTTFGKEALIKSIGLSTRTGQKQDASKLCEEFREKYPNDAKQVEEKCSKFKISSEGVHVSGIVINGRAKTVFLEDVVEPSLDDFSAEITIKRPNKEPEGYFLTKNEIITLNENPEFIYKIRLEEGIPVSDVISVNEIYLGFFGGKWLWSADLTGNKNWMEVGKKTIEKSNTKAYEGKSLSEKDAKFLKEQLEGKTLAQGDEILTNRKIKIGFFDFGTEKIPNTQSNDFIQLLDLTENSARIKLHIRSGSIDSEIVMRRNVNEQYGDYIFTVTKINLKKVARVSIIPSIRNTGTETNFSFTLGIEKRLIQLSPDKIQERIDTLNESIEKWEDTSDKVGEVVKTFNAVCLAVGTGLTIKNLFQNFDGRAIARQEVMRSPGGWFDFCKDAVNAKTYSTIDKCLAEKNDDIERDVDLFAGIISNQKNITGKNIEVRLGDIKKDLGTTIENPENRKEFIDISGDVGAAFTQKGYDDGGITLSQARDIDRLNQIISSNPSGEMKKLAEKKRYALLSDIKANSENFAKLQKAQENLEKSGFEDFSYRVHTRERQIEEVYDGLKTSAGNFNSIPANTFFQPISFNNKEYLVTLKTIGDKRFSIDKIFDEKGIVEIQESEEIFKEIKGSYSQFIQFDRTSYENKFKEPKVRYFETSPYAGLPAIVPFDTSNGWYVGTKQLIPGAAARLLTDKGGIRAYDESGQIRSFYICNVGKNGREEFYSELKDDICRNFNPGLQQVQGTFPGLNPSETSRLVSNAMEAVQDATRQHSQGVSRVSILNEFISVGEPSIGVPDIQCQDFMSPKECLILFNACDPVVCPSSRCNLGGTFTVPDVIQSGIIGSAALCLPNARENIAVPVCLSGIKAGIDGFVSVQKNYRDCLQTNLETGKTVGICDEIHSIYLCDFFWSQAQPVAGVIVPKIFEIIRGQTGRGGGEYLGVASSWENAQRSIDYMTNYYGAASFEAFKTGIIREVGQAVCRNFVSASYPDVNFFDSLIEPESPPQYTAWFSESPYTTSTVPPISRYKVFYHIFAGEGTLQTSGVRNAGVFYRVYLKTPQTGSFFNYAQTIQIADGFIPPGELASETRDFTAPSGYQQLCINVNGQEECGFNRVSTDFGLDYLQDLYSKQQGEQTDIKTESECVSGTPSLYSFANPNLQSGLQQYVDPNLYAQQIVRVCSTDNPGRGTDAKADGEGSRWVRVGKCDSSGNLKCYLDQNSVKKAITSTEIEDATLKATGENFVKQMTEEGQYFEDFKRDFEKLKNLDNNIKISSITTDLIAKAFLNSQKAELIMLRADAYAEIVVERIGKEEIRISKTVKIGDNSYITESEQGQIDGKNYVKKYIEDNTIIYIDDKGVPIGFSIDSGKNNKLYGTNLGPQAQEILDYENGLKLKDKIWKCDTSVLPKVYYVLSPRNCNLDAVWDKDIEDVKKNFGNKNAFLDANKKYLNSVPEGDYYIANQGQDIIIKP
ncbi:hypothetical protein HYT25_01280 [Candidatus Pacearchaeota archaeon]|nr:hypothetical protein [Candidatus Pacearchaeota archaeon]